mgnify:CR=1 FL=1
MWPRFDVEGIADEIAEIVRFHHPSFNPSLPHTFVNVERLLSEMRANEELFESSRPATGRFTIDELTERRQKLLLSLAKWFHELQRKALDTTPAWLTGLVDKMRRERAQVISFNWDLVLDELLFGDSLSPAAYGLTHARDGPRLIKPHGSLNWYEVSTGKHLHDSKKLILHGSGADAVYAFKPYRAPASSKRTYMPLIVPPVFNKQFDGPVFQNLWREAVSILSSASHVRFLGYSLAEADFHARFILRCGFHNQEHGRLTSDGRRESPTGRAEVTVVDRDPAIGKRIEEMVGWPVEFHNMTIREWAGASVAPVT